MAATVSKRISQETFDSVVQENVDDFEMEWSEAVADAIQQFEANDIDLSNIDTKTRPSERDTSEHPLISASKSLAGVTSETPSGSGGVDTAEVQEVLESIKLVSELLEEHSDLKVVAGAAGAMQGAWQAWKHHLDGSVKESSTHLLIRLVDNCGTPGRIAYLQSLISHIFCLL